MSEENVELVRGMWDAWNRGDLEWCLERLAPEYELHPARLFALDTREIYRGRDGFADFWSTFREAWESIRIEVQRMEDTGDGVLTLLIFHGTGRGSGADVSLRLANIVTVRDGLVARIRGFPEWEQALEAAGLEE